MFRSPLTENVLGMALKQEPTKTTTNPRGNGELEKGEKEKAERKLALVLGK